MLLLAARGRLVFVPVTRHIRFVVYCGGLGLDIRLYCWTLGITAVPRNTLTWNSPSVTTCCSLKMEVKSENHAMLCNFEVLGLLKDIQAGRGQKKPNKYQTNLATITYETIKCLENWPCAHHTPEGISAAMKSFTPYKLTPAEKLQLINLRPSSAVEIQLIVEESEERLSETQIEELLDILATHLPGPEGEGEEQEEMEEEEEVEDEQS